MSCSLWKNIRDSETKEENPPTTRFAIHRATRTQLLQRLIKSSVHHPQQILPYHTNHTLVTMHLRLAVKRTKSSDSFGSTISTDNLKDAAKCITVPTSILLANDQRIIAKKSVRFSKQIVVLPKAAANRKRSTECWYSTEEYQSFKKTFKEDCKALARSSQASDCTFRRVLSSVHTSCSLHKHEIDASIGSQLCRADQMDLIKSLRKSIPHLGLEKLSIRSLHEDKIARRACATQAIMELQDQNQCPETIRRALESISRTSRLFALETARAHACSSCWEMIWLIHQSGALIGNFCCKNFIRTLYWNTRSFDTSTSSIGGVTSKKSSQMKAILVSSSYACLLPRNHALAVKVSYTVKPTSS